MHMFFRNSMSRQMFLRILAITGFVLTVLFAVSLYLLQESYDREEKASVLEKLTKCSRITDLSLEYMGQDSRMLSTNASLISAVVAPDHNRADRSISVLNLLEDVARTNDLVSQAILYVDYDHSIYASDSLRTDLAEDDSLNHVISSYVLTNPSVEHNTLHITDGAAYILQDIPVNGRKRLGTVILEVDKENMYRQIQDMEDGSYIVVLGENGEVFLADEENAAQILEGIRSEKDANPERSASYTSSLSGLTFYNWKSDSVSFAETVARYSPLFLIVAFLALVGAVYSALASRAAYRPIRKLIEAVSAQTAAQTEEGLEENEIEYLKGLFDRTMADRESLIATTAVLIPEVERRLLTDVAEDPDCEERVRASLQDINSWFARESLIGVMALEADPQTENALDLIVREHSSDICQIRLLTFEGKPAILLFREDPSMSRDALRERMKELLLQIREDLGSSAALRAGIGSFCTTLGQIAGARKEACQVMTAALHKVKLPDAYVISTEQIRAHLSRCTYLVIDRKLQEAVNEAGQFCRALPLHRVSEEERRQTAASYGHEITRLFSLFGLEDVILPEITAEKEPSALVDQMVGYGTEYVEALGRYCQKKSNRQVVFAKQYIMDHYQDGMLSLGEIAEKTGIKPTYLSTLFAGVSGVRFSDFLKEYRVQMAKEYLKNSELPIKEIAMRCGFNSVQSFNRVFKQATGQSPGEYRVGRMETGKNS